MIWDYHYPEPDLLNTFGLEHNGFKFREMKIRSSASGGGVEDHEKSYGKVIRGSKVEAINMLSGHRIELMTEDEANKGMVLLNVVVKKRFLIWCICNLDKGLNNANTFIVRKIAYAEEKAEF
jgi:hypothetical protein